MKKITAVELVNQIGQLEIGRIYKYAGSNSRLQIKNIERPEGPISFVNIKPNGTSRAATISKPQLTTMALVCSSKPNYPLHIDRVFSAGGNTRSALETLLLYTPHFFICHPERVDAYSGKVLRNLKHIMWCPDEEHEWRIITEKDYNETITEIELGVDFGRIDITRANLGVMSI